MSVRRGIVRIVITLLLVYALLCFASSGRSLAEMERTAAELKGERESLERECAALRLRLLQCRDPARMEELARRELGMVMPGEIVFLFAEDEQAETDAVG